jgi:hypothetical protein
MKTQLDVIKILRFGIPKNVIYTYNDVTCFCANKNKLYSRNLMSELKKFENNITALSCDNINTFIVESNNLWEYKDHTVFTKITNSLDTNLIDCHNGHIVYLANGKINLKFNDTYSTSWDCSKIREITLIGPYIIILEKSRIVIIYKCFISFKLYIMFELQTEEIVSIGRRNRALIVLSKKPVNIKVNVLDIINIPNITSINSVIYTNRYIYLDGKTIIEPNSTILFNRTICKYKHVRSRYDRKAAILNFLLCVKNIKANKYLPLPIRKNIVSML